MNDKPIQPGDEPIALSGSAESTSPGAAPRFVSVKLQGVGGWLMFFVIGQLILRPLQFFGSRAKGLTAAEAVRFPATARIVLIEDVLLIGLVIAGIVVALTLFRTGSEWPVLLAKLYLIANPLVAILLAVLYLNTDLPPTASNRLITSGIMNAVGSSIVCVAWFLYFTKSKRVRATYFERIL